MSHLSLLHNPYTSVVSRSTKIYGLEKLMVIAINEKHLLLGRSLSLSWPRLSPGIPKRLASPLVLVVLHKMYSGKG